MFLRCSSMNDRCRDSCDFQKWRFSAVLSGAPDKIRTCDLCLRRAALYPAELRVQQGAFSVKPGAREPRHAEMSNSALSRLPSRRSEGHKVRPVIYVNDFTKINHIMRLVIESHIICVKYRWRFQIVMHVYAHLAAVRLHRMAGIAVCAALSVALCVIGLWSGRANAQNFVQDPNFNNGLAHYVSSHATTTFGGKPVALISGLFGMVEAYPLTTNIGWTYYFTFYAASASSGVPAAFQAVFGPTALPGDNLGVGSLFISPVPGLSLTKYTVRGIALTSTSYAYVESFSPGGLYVTGFDVAPAPVTGGGALSIGALVALVAVRGARRKISRASS
jgi:hypothetical protein